MTPKCLVLVRTLAGRGVSKRFLEEVRSAAAKTFGIEQEQVRVEAVPRKRHFYVVAHCVRQEEWPLQPAREFQEPLARLIIGAKFLPKRCFLPYPAVNRLVEIHAWKKRKFAKVLKGDPVELSEPAPELKKPGN